MGQKEVLRAVLALCERHGRSVTKYEIAKETGTCVTAVNHSLIVLKRWGEVKAELGDPATRGCPYLYSRNKRSQP